MAKQARKVSFLAIVLMNGVLLLWFVFSFLSATSYPVAASPADIEPLSGTPREEVVAQSSAVIVPILQAKQTETQTPVDDEAPLPLGVPCGAGELLPPWSLCLYGGVAKIDEEGQLEWLDGINITIERQGQMVSGTTFVHPGHLTPTYGIDISPLQPQFLEPVTLTVYVDDYVIERQVTILVDDDTQNQRVDLLIDLSDLHPAPLWGQVIDFTAGRVVTNAVIVAEYNGVTTTATTEFVPSHVQPIYSFAEEALAAVGAEVGGVLTLTASYNGDQDLERVSWRATGTQINFVTNWMCDDDDPLPREIGASGIPREIGASGIPDLACIWGYGRVDGIPVTGMQVQLEISGTIYAGVTRLYPGETTPRYAIGLANAQALHGQTITATGIYSGVTNNQMTPLSLTTNYHQRLDLTLNGTGALALFSNSDFIHTLVWYDEFLWAGTAGGGVVRWNPTDNSYLQLTITDGLAYNVVRSVVRDENGIFWFGTWSEGVSRYDPETGSWQTFNTTDGLADNDIFASAIDKNGILWFGTDSGGLSRYDPETGSWQTFNTTDGLANNWVHAIIIDENGVFWLGTYGGGVNRYDPEIGSWQTFTTADGLANDHVLAITKDNNGKLWFGTEGGASYYDPETGSWQTFTTDDGLADSQVWDIAPDEDGTFWFGTQGGVSHYDPETESWQTFTTADGLAHNEVLSVAIDENRVLWFGTWTGGISRYDPETGNWQTFSTPDGLADNDVTAVASTENNILWFGTYGGGLAQYDSRNKIWQSFFREVEGLTNTYINSVALDKNNKLWLGTNGGVIQYDLEVDSWQTFTTTDGLAHNVVKTIAIDENNKLWFGTENGVSRYDPEIGSWQPFTTADGLADNDVNVITIDGNGLLWFGTENGVSRYDPGDGSWQTFTTTDGLAHNVVKAIATDKHGLFWFGTENGVSRYDPGDGSWQTFTTIDGLAHNDVRAIVSDGDGVLWFGTWGGGVSRYDPRVNNWQHLTVNNGLARNNIYDIAIDGNGVLWFATAGGVNQWGQSYSDVSVQLGAKESVLPEQALTYTVVLANQGQWDTGHAHVTVTLPVSTTFITATIVPTSTNPLVWQLDNLPVGGEAITLVVRATVNEGVAPDSVLTATVHAIPSAPEEFLGNNQAQVTTFVRDPYRADVRVSAAGLPVLPAGNIATYTLYIDNIGGLVATSTVVTVDTPPYLGYAGADPEPTSLTPLTWDLGDLPDLEERQISLSMLVDENVPANTRLGLTAAITTTAPDSNPLNNSGTITIATTLTDALTLILVAPQRMVAHHGASPVMDKLYQLAEHPQVRGVVLDVERDAAVRDAYAAWALDPGNWQSVNGVAAAIKTLIDNYTITYPNLRYLVFVGGDEIIPFYRVADQNPTMWQESIYAYHMPKGTTMRATMGHNFLLTDDFYSDRTPDIVTSPWIENHTLYLPDFASGRLLETPAEIMATIDAFLQNDGVLNLDSALVGGDPYLTRDLDFKQCQFLNQNGLDVTCGQRGTRLGQHILDHNGGLMVVSPHSNHLSLGYASAQQMAQREIPFDQSLLFSIGCHAGLNVPDVAGVGKSYDWMQAFAGQGGTAVASTAYTYASPWVTGYSEQFSRELTYQLLLSDQETVGEALERAKHAYFRDFADVFDSIDEKVLLPMTLYGLPMLRITHNTAVRQSTLQSTQPTPLIPMTVGENDTLITMTLSNLIFTETESDDGRFYTYQGQARAQEHLPVQPSAHIPVTHTLANGRFVHGVVLRHASYAEIPHFDPVINQTWVLEQAERGTIYEPQVTIEGWDRKRPYGLTRFAGVSYTTESLAGLNLVLGAFHGQQQVERLFDGLTLELRYSDSDDQTPPTIHNYNINKQDGFITAIVSDASGIAEAIAVCDDGQSQWQTSPLTLSDNQWSGTCPTPVNRTYVQVVDKVGNVAVSDWYSNSNGHSEHLIFLPILIHNSIPSTPDLIVEEIIVNQNDIQVVIKNSGDAPVLPHQDFWVDIYINPHTPPTKVNQVWQDLGDEGLVWGVTASALPLAPGETLTLRIGDAYYAPEHSDYTQVLPPNSVLYAQVDAVNLDTNYGNVLESHELHQAAYNNIKQK